MNYGDIIKRSWHITWRYKALWVLGIFAGVSGCQGSTGSNYTRSGSRDFSQFSGQRAPIAGLRNFMNAVDQYLPLLIAATLALLLMVLLLSVLAIAARGGLVTGANAADEGRRLTLSELWGAGFGRFWTLVGLDIILKLPVAALGLAILVGIGAPLLGTLLAGGEPGGGTLVSICGVAAIGLPLLLVLSFVLGVMYLIALRYVMLGGQRAFEAAGNGWHFFRARFKDTFLLWLINAGLNIAASLALAIPVVVLGVAVAVPMAMAGIADQWSVFAGLVFLLIVLVLAIATLYNGVWGTFTSALWTVFFRDVAGMSALAQPALVTEPTPPPGVADRGVAPSPDAPPMAPWEPAGFPSEPPVPPSVEPASAPVPEPPPPPMPPMPPAPPTDG